MTTAPDFILYAQHGWADTSKIIAGLARELAPPDAPVLTPELGWWRTWLRIEPLIERAGRQVEAALMAWPGARLRVIGHSMGGLIALELLGRRRDWWPRIGSLALLAAPVGGADLARMIDPFSIGVGIARDLGVCRRPLAEAIARAIPTFSIAGDIDGGSDGVVTVGATEFDYARTLTLPGLSHTAIRNHPCVARAIRAFWCEAGAPATSPAIIRALRAVPGMTDAHRRDFCHAHVIAAFDDGTTIRVWKNPLQVDHVFVADRDGRCLFAGFVGWVHAAGLRAVIEQICGQAHGLYQTQK